MEPQLANSHHLHLFCFAARHGGITPALPYLPYGMTQSGLSTAMSALRKEYKVDLYELNPFRLTAAGKVVYEAIRGYYEMLPYLPEKARDASRPTLTVGASEMVLSQYLPAVMARVKALRPEVQFRFQNASPSELHKALTAENLNAVILSVTEIPKAFDSLLITRLPLVLLVPRSLPKSQLSADLFRQPGKLPFPLLCPPAEEAVCHRFFSVLAARNIEFQTKSHTSSVASVAYFVAQGQGIGISLDLPVLTKHPGVRVIKLPDFAPVDVVALSRPSPDELTSTLLQTIRDYAVELRSSKLVPPLPEPVGLTATT